MTDSVYSSKVKISDCNSYDKEKIRLILKEHFKYIGVTSELIRDKKIVIKPNLVTASAPSSASTTHPSVIEAVYEELRELGANDVIIAESPGGPYNVPCLKRIYRATGISEMSEVCGLPLNLDCSFRKMSFSEGRKLKEFDIITPIAEADIIFNICKLKTHSLTGLSCAIKNLFGVIPGTLKFEMHAAYPNLDSFSEMLVDLNLTLMERKKIISVCDAIVSMEGNGPTNGTPVNTGLILTSDNAFFMDIAAEKLAGIQGETKYLDIGAERLGISRICSDELAIADRPNGLLRPDSKSGAFLKSLQNIFGGRISRFFEPKPKISVRCIGCGKCVESCPQKTITLEMKKGKKIAKIKYGNCIRCYCCQELCPHGAVDTSKNFILRSIH